MESSMDSLAEIMARVERLAFAQEQEQQGNPQALQLSSSLEQATLPLDLPAVELLPPPEYIPTVSPLIIPLLYYHINGFQRASRVEKP